jgi:hypothetical protein
MATQLATADSARPSPALLRRPLIPFDLIQDIGGGLRILRRDDPVLWRLASYQDERTYRIMRETTDVISSSIGALTAFVLGFGWRVTQLSFGARHRGPRAQQLVDLAKAQLQMLMVPTVQRVTTLPDFLEIAAYHFYEGWLPMRATWETQAYMHNGRWKWGIVELQEQHQEDYAFTAEPAPRLVELNRFAGTGGDRPPLVIPPDEERAWLIFRAGSTRTPYGRAFLRDLYVPWRILQTFSEWYYRGARNALSGVPVLKESLPSAASPLLSQGKIDAGQGSATLAAIVQEAKEVIRLYEEQGILVVRGGFDYDVLTNIATSKGWQEALNYIETKFVVAIRGETLTSDVGDSGSRAVADVHQSTKLTYAQRLARHIEPTISQMLALVVEANEGEIEPEDLPIFSFRVHKRSNPEHVELLRRGGAKVAIEPLADEYGIELAPPDADESEYLKTWAIGDEGNQNQNVDFQRRDPDQPLRRRVKRPSDDKEDDEDGEDDESVDEPAQPKRRKVVR